jgi:nitrogen regulatory protein PII
MVRVEAIIRGESLDAVVQRLLLIGVRGLTMLPVREAHRADAYYAFFRGKILIEWYGSDDEADGIVRAIERAAAMGAPGDDHILVQTVEQALRIRTGERGPTAA